MTVQTKKKTLPDNSTQRYLPFSQIRDNIVIMKDNSLRVILKCSTINLLLKSEEEQDSIIVAYQRFLSSIDFPVQIIIRSKKLDIDGYLNNMSNKAINQKNPLIQQQTYEYMDYLRKLIEVAQVQKKEFYIIIPYDIEENKSVRNIGLVGTFSKFWESINSGTDLLKIKEQIRLFEKMKKPLITRANKAKTALESIGIKAKELDKKELVNYLTDYYNPTIDTFDTIKNDIDNYDIN